MLRKYKYDVAISVAEEDLPIAESIANYLKVNRISYYLYTEHAAKQWGDNLMAISYEKYSSESKYVLILLSERYLQKRWAGVEQQFAEAISARGINNILPLQLDNTPVDKLGKDIVFMRWKNNPAEITRSIEEKLSVVERRLRKRMVKYALFFLLLLSVVFYSVFLVNFRVNKRIKKLEEREQVKDTVKKITPDPLPNPETNTYQTKNDSATLKLITDNIGSSSFKMDSSSVKPQAHLAKATTCYVEVDGNDVQLKEYILQELDSFTIQSGFVQTGDSSQTQKKISLSFALGSEETGVKDAENHMVFSYLLRITDITGTKKINDTIAMGDFNEQNLLNKKSVAGYLINVLKSVFKND